MDGVSQRKEIHMKRMTLLTSLIMVFSLITATAAIAGTGRRPETVRRHRYGDVPDAGTDGPRQVQEPSCQAGDPESECEPVQDAHPGP